jgi:HK97 family phage prohead protease
MVRDMEFKKFSLDSENVDIEERKIFGYAATFGNKDLVGDVIVPGAFKKTLEEAGPRVKVFYNHTQPIGRPLKMEEDEKGLYVEARISKTAKGDEILELIKDGAISEMSIAYEVIQDEKKADGRYLKEIKLFEFGPVDFPANPEAVISGVKALADRYRESDLGGEKLGVLRALVKSLSDALGPEESSQEEAVDFTPQIKGILDDRSEKLNKLFKELLL